MRKQEKKQIKRKYRATYATTFYSFRHVPTNYSIKFKILSWKEEKYFFFFTYNWSVNFQLRLLACEDFKFGVNRQTFM